ncbi:MAG: recombinase family protein, partial [Blastochloris sp.]|nr:recombinase family protein [Blastochloris sp.]
NRFGRDAAEGLAAINELRRLGVEVRVADIPSLDVRRPEGMFVFSFLLAQGQYEVENLGSESIKGMQEFALRGGWPFVAPDGYLNYREHIGSHHRRCWIGIDRKRAAIQRLMFRWYARGTISVHGVALRLNALHERRVAAGKSGCLRKSGKPWQMQQVWKHLRNPFYAGIIVVPTLGLRVTGTHRPIVSQALFDRVQAVMHLHSQGVYDRNHYLLQGRVVMQQEDGHVVVLGCTTVRAGQHQYYYYRIGKRRCHIAVDRIDDAVVAHVQQQLASLGTDVPRAVARRMRRALSVARSREQATMQVLAQQRQRLVRVVATGYFTDDEIAAELQLINVDMGRAEQEYQRLSALFTNQEALIVEWQWIARHMQQWATLTDREQRELMHLIVQQVEVDAQGVIVAITWTTMWEQLMLPER